MYVSLIPLPMFPAGLIVASALVDISQQKPSDFKDKSQTLKNRKALPPAHQGTCVWLHPTVTFTTTGHIISARLWFRSRNPFHRLETLKWLTGVFLWLLTFTTTVHHVAGSQPPGFSAFLQTCFCSNRYRLDFQFLNFRSDDSVYIFVSEYDKYRLIKAWLMAGFLMPSICKEWGKYEHPFGNVSSWQNVPI